MIKKRGRRRRRKKREDRNKSFHFRFFQLLPVLKEKKGKKKFCRFVVFTGEEKKRNFRFFRSCIYRELVTRLYYARGFRIYKFFFLIN